MTKLNPTTLIVVAQLALMINSVAGLPIEASNIDERDMELERRGFGGGFGALRMLGGLGKGLFQKHAGNLLQGHVGKFIQGHGSQLLHQAGSQVMDQFQSNIQSYPQRPQLSYYKKRDLEYTLEPRAHGLAKTVGRGIVESGIFDTLVQQGAQHLSDWAANRVYRRDLGDGVLGNRDLEERDWSDLDAREYLDMNELD